jgi:hypothetical protein
MKPTTGAARIISLLSMSHCQDEEQRDVARTSQKCYNTPLLSAASPITCPTSTSIAGPALLLSLPSTFATAFSVSGAQRPTQSRQVFRYVRQELEEPQQAFVVGFFWL